MSDEHDFESDFSEEIEPHTDDDLIDEPAGAGDDLAWEDEEGQSSEASDAADGTPDAVKKKSSVKLIGGIVGAIVVVLLGLHFLTSSAPPAEQPAAPAPVPAKAIVATTSSDPVIPPGGLMNNPAAVGSVEQLQQTHATEAPAAVNMPQPVPLPAFMPVTSAPGVIAAAPPAAAPAAPMAAQSQPSTPQPLTPLPSTAPAVAITAPSTQAAKLQPAALPATAPAVDMATMLAPVLSRLDAMDAEIKTLKSNSVDKDTIDGLNKQLSTLQARLDALPKAAEAGTTSSTAASPAPVANSASTASPALMPAPLVHKTAVHHWTLRSAEPGEALLADQDGKLVTVHTGDMVPGLGHVTSIAEHAGAWLVRGTEGRVTE